MPLLEIERPQSARTVLAIPAVALMGGRAVHAITRILVGSSIGGAIGSCVGRMAKGFGDRCRKIGARFYLGLVAVLIVVGGGL